MPSPTPRIPDQRWQIADPPGWAIAELSLATGLPPLLARVLHNRGYHNADHAQRFLNPDRVELTDPLDDFADLSIAIDLIHNAITNQEKIAICGDYDADGMTSTALLLRALRSFNADIDYAIPSRMNDGYGINSRIVDRLADDGVHLIITVDNGIAAYDAIQHARDRGLHVIITDHHDLPATLPPASAILNPKMIDRASPYAGMAGVGVAYLLAMSVAEEYGQVQQIQLPMLELLTLGTIADLAPLTGVNRRWVQQGLKLIPHSQIPGIQALTQVSGSNSKQALKPDAIGFRLGPRINAIGRIGDPKAVIELLTTDDPGIALEQAMVCEQTNKERQAMCSEIQAAAIDWCESYGVAQIRRDRVLVVVQPGWHHGVIGIVASRLVERYGVPVFIGTYEDPEQTEIRGSARGIPEFNVFEGLNACGDLLGKYGGHPAAGGFSLAGKHLDAFRDRLSRFAHECLKPEDLKPLIVIDAEAQFDDLDLDLYREIDRLHPCGIGNPNPVFWASNVTIAEQSKVGKDGLKLRLQQDTHSGIRDLKAIAWGWADYCPLPSPLDVAFKLREQEWNGNVSLELEVLGARLTDQTRVVYPDRPILETANTANTDHSPTPPTPIDPPAAPPPKRLKHTAFRYESRTYNCGLYTSDRGRELRIRNDRGQVLSVFKGSQTGLLGTSREDAKEVTVSQPHFYRLIKAAMAALDL
ncbi:MAG: single-stranded-DNA-specific exonuclease RecJ [Oscillatoriales cyanobacterium]|nr:MAG: single-stranded-DNA-specific exonuclease RecJ [Oscillatoriales cyanobacterium]